MSDCVQEIVRLFSSPSPPSPLLGIIATGSLFGRGCTRTPSPGNVQFCNNKYNQLINQSVNLGQKVIKYNSTITTCRTKIMDMKKRSIHGLAVVGVKGQAVQMAVIWFAQLECQGSMQCCPTQLLTKQKSL